MRAIGIQRGASRPTLLDLDRPVPTGDEVLVRTLRVGIDGTDYEVIHGNHGGFPADAEYHVLGHEAVGVVEESVTEAFEPGDVVVPTVRRPPDTGTNRYFERGEPDMAPAGAYVERGIVGAHGYMAEFFTSPPEHLVRIPQEFATAGYLIEPISNAEKALELANASRSSFEWEPESAIVLGNGPLGLLTLAMLTADGFERLYCLGRRDRPDPTIDIIERLGATYVDSRQTPLTDLADEYEPMDLVFEATGWARHAFETIEALAPGGVGALLGIPSDEAFEVPGGRLHREFVLENKALVGSVNSNVRHYEAAVETLADYPGWFVDALVTDEFDPEQLDEIFEGRRESIKAVVEFDTL